MKIRKRKNAAGAGRPPAGAAGEKSSSYPKVRIEPTVLAGLKQVADDKSVAVWQVVTEAGRHFLAKFQGDGTSTLQTAPTGDPSTRKKKAKKKR